MADFKDGLEAEGPANVVRPVSSSASSGTHTRVVRILGFLSLLLLSFALWWQPISSTLRLALTVDAYSHILLIVPLSLALVYTAIKKNAIPCAMEPRLGVVLLAAAVLVRGFAAWHMSHLSESSDLSLSMFALAVWWIGSVIAIFGLQTFRTLLFPLCFLFLAVPFPDRVLNSLTESLQHQSAVGAELLFRAAHVPVERNGIVLSIPGVDIEVARECSSIRSSTMLIIITMVVAYLFLRSWWRQALLVAAAIPLSVAKNAVRIFTIAELATRVDPSYFNGRLHHQGGIVFLGLALVPVAVLLWILRRSEVRAAQTIEPH